MGTDLATNRKVYINSATRLLAGVPEKTGDSERASSAREGVASPGGGGGVPLPGSQRNAAADADEPATNGNAGKSSAAPKPPKKNRVAPAGTRRRPRQKADGKLSGLDAAAKVLAEASKPMRVEEIISAAKEKGYWESKTGKTPGATVYAAIIREIRDKGADSRFVKKDRGLFAASGAKQ